MQSSTIVQVVKRFHPFGGMEFYVWRLCHELVELNVKVIVLCEHYDPSADKRIQCYVVRKSPSKPRWLSHIVFSRRIRSLIDSKGFQKHLIHSHERITGHHITSLHGPAFFQVKFKHPYLWRFSLRILINLYLERREISSPSLIKIIPNSLRTKSRYMGYFGKIIEDKTVDPIYPGSDLMLNHLKKRTGTYSIRVGFVGSEMDRKGFTRALQIISKINAKEVLAKLLVFGPNHPPSYLTYLEKEPWIEFKGWTRPIDIYRGIDILLHPALDEPFGMVILEAMTCAVPVVISDQCGASELVNKNRGSVLRLDQSDEDWIAEIHKWIDADKSPPPFRRSWREVALSHVHVYKETYFLQCV